MVFFSGVNLLVKYLDYIPFFQLIIFRAVISAVISFITLKKLNIPVWGNDKKTLLARGFFGTIALLLYFYSIQNLPLASAVTFQYLSPIFSTLLAYVILKESLSKKDILLFVLAFCGVYLVKGFDSRITGFEVVIAVSGAALAGVAYTLVSKLRHTDNEFVVVFYFPVVTIPLVAPFAINYWVWPKNSVHWLGALGVGLLTHMAQIMMTKGYQQGKMKFVSIYKYAGVIIAIVTGYLLFDESISWQSLLGICLILISLLLTNLKVKRLKS